MSTSQALQALVTQLLTLTGNPREGLPAPVFRLISQLTPLVNVDLLIQDSAGRTLLTWRADEFYGPGWHIPGGIIRFKENAATRIAQVAQGELGCTVDFDPTPITLREVMASERDIRGHFISLLYRCRLKTPPAPGLAADVTTQLPLTNGQWQWHESCPPDLIRAHHMYRPWIAAASPPHT